MTQPLSIKASADRNTRDRYLHRPRDGMPLLDDPEFLLIDGLSRLIGVTDAECDVLQPFTRLERKPERHRFANNSRGWAIETKAGPSCVVSTTQLLVATIAFAVATIWGVPRIGDGRRRHRQTNADEQCDREDHG